MKHLVKVPELFCTLTKTLSRIEWSNLRAAELPLPYIYICFCRDFILFTDRLAANCCLFLAQVRMLHYRNVADFSALFWHSQNNKKPLELFVRQILWVPLDMFFII